MTGPSSTSVVVEKKAPIGTAVNLRGQIVDSSATKFYGHVIGLTTRQARVGFQTEIMLYGEMHNPAWNWPQDALFTWNGTTLSTEPPSTGFFLQMGIAKAPDTVFVDPVLPVLLT